MRKSSTSALVALACAIHFPPNVTLAQTERPSASPRIGIIYTAPHPVINDIIQGIKEVVLADIPGATFIERHASGNPAEYGNTVLAVIGEEPTLLMPITTPISKLTVDQARGRIPTVFVGVTDAVGSKIVDSLEHPGRATGSSDVCPFEALLKLAREVFPNARSLGLPYNPADDPAVFGLNQFTKLSGAYGFSISGRQVTSRDELTMEVRGIASRVDAILIGPDNLMMENPDLVATAARSEGRALLACDATSVEKGAVAGVGIQYRDVGKAAGERAVKVLHGADPGSLPVAILNSGEVVVNKKAACLTKVAISPELLRRAKVIEGNYKCQ